MQNHENPHEPELHAHASEEAAGPEQIRVTEEMRGRHWSVPRVDITEDTAEIRVIADLPGVLHEDIDVTFEKDELRIRGRVRGSGIDAERYDRREFAPGGFQRTFRVGESIDSAAVRAEHAHGVLTLHLPKVEEERPRSIPVRSH